MECYWEARDAKKICETVVNNEKIVLFEIPVLHRLRNTEYGMLP